MDRPQERYPLLRPYAISLKDKPMIERWMIWSAHQLSKLCVRVYEWNCRKDRLDVTSKRES